MSKIKDYSPCLLTIVFLDTSLVNTNKRSLDEIVERETSTATKVTKTQGSEYTIRKVSWSMYNSLLQEKKALIKQIEQYKSTWMRKSIVSV